MGFSVPNALQKVIQFEPERILFRELRRQDRDVGEAFDDLAFLAVHLSCGAA